MCSTAQPAETPATSKDALAVLCKEWLDDLEIKRTRKPTQSDYVRMIQRRRRFTANLVADLAKGNIDADEFSYLFEDGLRRSHINAAVMGRQRAGDLAEESEIDEIFGISRADRDSLYFRKFLEDIRSGRYGPMDELDRDAIIRRALMYVDKSRATANEALTLTSPVDALFDWVTMQDERTCGTCPSKARGGPYTAMVLQLIGQPGQGQDQCLTNCRCVVRRQDGVVGFGFVPMVTLHPTTGRIRVGVPVG
jgi:hypothetical protein